MGRTRRIAVLITMTGAALAVAGGAASAQPYLNDHYHEEDGFLDTKFCDVTGLEVSVAWVKDGHLLVRRRPGKNGELYFTENVSQKTTFTNAAGDFISTKENFSSHDSKITNNGDGTLTIINFGTGNFVLYDEAGRVIARDPGQTRFKTVISENGTPDDPFDDEVLSFEVIRESTGRSDDFCAAALPELT